MLFVSPGHLQLRRCSLRCRERSKWTRRCAPFSWPSESSRAERIGLADDLLCIVRQHLTKVARVERQCTAAIPEHRKRLRHCPAQTRNSSPFKRIAAQEHVGRHHSNAVADLSEREQRVWG